MSKILSGVILCGMAVAFTARAQPVSGAFSGGAPAGTNGPVNVPKTAFTLTNTGAAPLGAGGSVRFNQPDTLVLETHGLATGEFPVLAVRKSDGARVLVGLLALHNPTHIPDRQANQDSRSETVTHAAKMLQTKTALPLPPDLPASDIGQVIVAGTGGNDLLVGLVPPSPAAQPPLLR